MPGKPFWNNWRPWDSDVSLNIRQWLLENKGHKHQKQRVKKNCRNIISQRKNTLFWIGRAANKLSGSKYTWPSLSCFPPLPPGLDLRDLLFHHTWPSFSIPLPQKPLGSALVSENETTFLSDPRYIHPPSASNCGALFWQGPRHSFSRVFHCLGPLTFCLYFYPINLYTEWFTCSMFGNRLWKQSLLLPCLE